MSARGLALILGLGVAAPAVRGGFVTGTIPTEQALTRVGVILVVALVAGHLLDRLVRSYLTVHAGDAGHSDSSQGP